MAGNYLKSLQLAKQLEERAKEASKNRDIAEKENEALQQFLKHCKESDVDISAVEKPQRDFETAMAAKDYQTAIAHAKRAREAAKDAYIRKIGDVADSVDSIVTLIKGAGSEAKAALDLVEKSKDRVVNDDLDGAMKYARSAFDSAERTLHEVFSELFSQAQETIMQAKELGDDVSIFDDQLSKAKSALENQEYEACMTQITEVLEGAGEDVKSQIRSTISRAEELVAAGEEFGTDMSRVKSHIEKADSQLEAHKYKESLAYAKKAEMEGENASSSKLQELVRETRESIKKFKGTKEDITVPQELLDQAQNALKEKKYIEALHALNASRERVHQIQFNSVLEVITDARDRFVLAKKVGVDMSKAITLLNTSRDHLKLGKFQDAIDYAEQSRKEVDAVLQMFYTARDQIAELGKAVKFAVDLGADVTSVKGSLSDARKFFEAKDYENTAETTKRGIAEAKKLAYDRAMGVINSADKLVKLGKEISADMTEAEGTLQKALDSLSKEAMAESVSLAMASHEAAKAAMTRVMSDRLQSIDQFVQGSAVASGMGEIADMIAQARQHLVSSEFDKSQALVREITHKIENIGQGESEKLVSVASAKIDGLKAMAGDASDLEILLTRASEAISKRVFEDASARAREIIQQADDAMARLLQAEFSSIKDSLEEAKTIGIDLDEAKVRLKDARARAEAQDFPAAFKIIGEAKETLQQKIARYDGIKGKIRRTEELISEAGKTKVDVTSLIKRLDNARNQFANGYLDEAEGILDKCLAETEKNLAMYLAAKFILSSKERIDLAQANGIDIDTVSKLLARAKDLMKLKNYEEALATAKQCDEESKRRITASVVEMIRNLQRLLADAKNVGVDTLGPERLAEKAQELAKAGDFMEAFKCLASARDDIDHIKNLSSQAALEIRVARNNLKDAETLDMDVGRSREFLDQAVEALTRHQYAIALELARKSSEVSSEVSKSRIWGTLEKFKDRIDKSATQGLTVGMAERCVSDGIRAFREGRYQDALKLAMACEVEMERAELQRDISARAVELARMKQADAMAEGIRSQRLSDLVKKAEELLSAGKYVDAMTAAIESGDELHLIRENLDSCRIELSSLKERVERLKKINIYTSECDDMLEMAQEHLTAHEFAKTREALKRASAKAESLFENSIKDVTEQNRLMISKAKGMGINTKACEDMLEVANTSFAEKLWDFAYQQAMACRTSCLELIAKKISSLIEEVEGKISTLGRLGASSKPVEELVEKARKAGADGDIAGAFQILMQADQKISNTEEAHKKYLDISIAAESAIDALGRFGLSKREPERLIAMADIEKERDYDSAIELVAEALDTAKSQMESYSPDVTGSFSAKGLQQDVDGELTVTLKNAGKALAKDIWMEVTGDFDVKQAPAIVSLKPGAEEAVKVKLHPKRSGSVAVKLKVTSKRQFDGKMMSFEIEDAVNVFPAGPPFKIGRATDQTRCIACQGRIKQGFDIVTCRCGGQLHLSCAKRSSECPICGQKYSF